MKIEEIEKDNLNVHRENFRMQSDYAYKNADFINHWIVSASLGSFGLSFAFIKSLNGPLNAIFLLYIAWVGFIFSIFAIIFLYYLANKISSKTQEKINEVVKKNFNQSSDLYNFSFIEGPFKKYPKLNWKKFSNWISIMCLLLFSLALVSSLLFAIFNISQVIK